MHRIFIPTLMLAWPATAPAAGLSGNWITQDRSAIVAIAPCGTKLCGAIARILVDKPGVPSTDVRNPDPALRSKPLVGLRILSGFTGKDDRWDEGRIYDPQSGKSYRSKLRLNKDGSLNVSGCIAFLCKTQSWTRGR